MIFERLDPTVRTIRWCFREMLFVEKSNTDVSTTRTRSSRSPTSAIVGGFNFET